jgi:hypothetical protein
MESPIVIPDGSEPPTDHFCFMCPRRIRVVSHLILAPDGSSLYDHFGSGFTLVTDGNPEAESLRAARARTIPLKTSFRGTYGFMADTGSFCLIRLIGVAWRRNKMPLDVDHLLNCVTGFPRAAQSSKQLAAFA